MAVHVPLDRAVAMVLSGEIHDAKSIIGLLVVERQLQNADRSS